MCPTLSFPRVYVVFEREARELQSYPSNIAVSLTRVTMHSRITNILRITHYYHRMLRKTQRALRARTQVLQPVHTDSDWGKRKKQNPRPHYYTILIALSPHNKHTGGTKLYPGSHRDVSIEPDESKATHLDLNPGDALVFDGLLLHCGMPNLSGTTGHGEEQDRFLYYTAISTDRVDANTQVTGV